MISKLDKNNIFPKNPTKEDLLKALNGCDLETIQTIYRLLVEFDCNSKTSSFEDFICK